MLIIRGLRSERAALSILPLLATSSKGERPVSGRPGGLYRVTSCCRDIHIRTPVNPFSWRNRTALRMKRVQDWRGTRVLETNLEPRRCAIPFIPPLESDGRGKTALHSPEYFPGPPILRMRLSHIMLYVDGKSKLANIALIPCKLFRDWVRLKHASL
jgi:hypothetical protein